MNYIQQAYKGDNTTWKVVLTTLITSGIFILNFIFYLLTSKEDMDMAYDLMKNIPANLSLFINLGPFVILLGILFFLVYVLHKRSLLSLTTSRPKVDLKRIAFSFCMVVSFTLITFFMSYSVDSSEIVFQFKPLKFAILFIISLVLFPFQIGFEEYLFRGFLMQQLGVALKSKWMPLVITSVLFGVMHSANPEVAEMGYFIMVFYIGTGLLLGIMTLMDDGLELALGFHLGNNLMAALLITSDWSALQTDAIFKYTSEQASQSVAEIVAPILIVFPIYLFILAKVYKWNNWKEKLFGKLEKPSINLVETPVSEELLDQ